MVFVRRVRGLASNQARRLLKIDFFRFALVGATGFSISFVLLYILHGKMGMPYSPALILSNEGGLLSNFVFHETWTYKHLDHKHKPIWQKFWHFHMSSWSGIILIFIIGTVSVKVFHVHYLISQVIASGVVMFWNFFWTKFFIFKGKTPTVLSNIEESVEVTIEPKSQK